MNTTHRLFGPVLLAWLAAWSVTAQTRTLAIKGTSVSVDLSGVITVADNHACTVSQYAPDGRLLREIGGQGWGNNQFDRPAGIWAKNGIDVFVADYGNHRIQRFDNALAYVSTLFTRDDSDPAKRFGYPTSVSISRLGELFICDGENNRIAKVGSTNQVELTFGGFGAGEGRLFHPLQLDCGPNDDVYVLDPPRVVIFDAFGNYLKELGPGIFQDPVAMSANQSQVLVVDTAAVYLFDDQQHLIGRSALQAADLAGSYGGCSLTFSAVYLIGADGLHIVPLAVLLDKEQKSR